MSNFARLRTLWTGPGGPGYSNLDVGISAATPDEESVDDCAAAWRTYWDTLKGYLPNDWQVNVSSEVLIIDVEDNELVDTLTAASSGSAVTGTGSGTWAGAVGVCTRLSTADVVNGRRVRGKTFFVPAVSASAFDADGTLNSTCVSDFTSATTTLHAAIVTAGLGRKVYSPTHRALYDMTGFTVLDRSAVLRSRRA